MELQYDPEISLLDEDPKQTKTCVSTETYIGMLIAALFIIAQRCMQSKCPSTNGWINKTVAYIQPLKGVNN